MYHKLPVRAVFFMQKETGPEGYFPPEPAELYTFVTLFISLLWIFLYRISPHWILPYLTAPVRMMNFTDPLTPSASPVNV